MTANPISQIRTFVDRHIPWPASPLNLNKEKVWEAVKLAFKCLLALGLLALNPTLFIAGLIIGAVAPKKITKLFENMFAVQKKWPIYSALFIGATACVALPALSGTTSLLFAAYMSSKLIKICKNTPLAAIAHANNVNDHVVNVHAGNANAAEEIAL